MVGTKEIQAGSAVMSSNNLRNYALLGVMIVAMISAIALRPAKNLADNTPPLELEKLVPEKFGDWHIDNISHAVVSPDVQAALNKVYAQTLTRTYINANGQRIMLSIAYGKDQSDNLQIHLPEGCYQGQGFAVDQKQRGFMKTPYGDVPVVRLVAKKSLRVEPITYWITLGTQAVQDGWGMKKAKLAYAFKGVVPDGLLMRVSTIGQDIQGGYELQENFTETLLASVSPEQRERLVGYK
jgi:EpsI family protein